MDAFVKVFEEYPEDRIKINDTLDKFMRLPLIYQPKIGYGCLIQNIVLKELINIVGTAITDLDIELEMKNSRIKNLENRNSIICKYIPVSQIREIVLRYVFKSYKRMNVIFV